MPQDNRKPRHPKTGKPIYSAFFQKDPSNLGRGFRIKANWWAQYSSIFRKERNEQPLTQDEVQFKNFVEKFINAENDNKPRHTRSFKDAAGEVKELTDELNKYHDLTDELRLRNRQLKDNESKGIWNGIVRGVKRKVRELAQDEEADYSYEYE